MINTNLLRAKIIGCGLNNGELAMLVGVNPGTISNMLLGKNYPSYYVLRRIICILKLDPSDFYEIFFSSTLSEIGELKLQYTPDDRAHLD